MAQNVMLSLLSAAVLLSTLSSQARATDVTLPNGITVASLNKPTEGSADLGDKPTVTKPNQVFSTSGKTSSNSVGTDNGDVFVNHQDQTGSTDLNTADLKNAGGRKMLGTLELSGDGVSAGDNTLGGSVKAYGHGELNGLEDNHIMPHGVQTTADVGGKSYTTNAGVNPDGVAREGPIVDAGRK